jgi:hypothetical protein
MDRNSSPRGGKGKGTDYYLNNNIISPNFLQEAENAVQLVREMYNNY